MATSKERGLTSQLKKSADKRFYEQESSHRPPGSQPSDYGYSTPSITRFTQHTSSHHTSESAASDYGYNIVANSQQLSYYAPHKDKGGDPSPPAFDGSLKRLDELRAPGTKRELIEIIESLPDGVLRPVYKAAAELVNDPALGGAMGRDRLKSNPPRARWATRTGTDDADLDAAAFIQKHYGAFLDGTTTRRDVEEIDLRVIRALRELPKDRQDILNLPVGRGATTHQQDLILEQISRGQNGPIPYNQLRKLVQAKDKRLRNG